MELFSVLVPKATLVALFSNKNKNSIIPPYKMFPDTNSIKTFHQASCKMLNCSKHNNRIKFCFHN